MRCLVHRSEINVMSEEPLIDKAAFGLSRRWLWRKRDGVIDRLGDCNCISAVCLYIIMISNPSRSLHHTSTYLIQHGRRRETSGDEDQDNRECYPQSRGIWISRRALGASHRTSSRTTRSFSKAMSREGAVYTCFRHQPEQS
jgi:hypothetical protein